MLADARSNKLQELNQLSDYEQTVKNAIEMAEKLDESLEMEKDDDDEKDGKKNAFGIIATVGNAFANYVRGNTTFRM